MIETSPKFTMESAKEYIDSMAFRHNSAAASYRISDLVIHSHAISALRGWWTDRKTNLPLVARNEGEMIALMHSELSEMLEGLRTDAPSDKLHGFTSEEEEAADLLHRLFDYAAARGLKLGDAFVAKSAYNRNRADHSLESRNAPGGKKF